ncbi:hypothetical protein PtA15_2A632 [Puccinia triticina]|uniref:Uncharacterized protein n=1 Tax=Puccinia triticina TaxID=208348 RepID=A0ABY7CB09_9BASI|nr:uncharacterized protein PtA15_2A632 [Puccinia triticina]WAQ82315.1 hypothetical protein PtA15_2A632 [Puccinia triticina]
MQRAAQIFHLDRMVYNRSRLVWDYSGWKGTKPPRDNINKLNPDAPPAKPAQAKEWDYECDPLYVISICDFPWKRLPSIPVELHEDWLLWLAPHWKVGSNRPKRADNVPAIPQKEPVVQFVFISLPTAHKVLGDSVDNTLDNLFISQLVYDDLPAIEKSAYDEWEKTERQRAADQLEVANKLADEEFEAKVKAEQAETEAAMEDACKRAEDELKADQEEQDAEIEELEAKLLRHGDL